MEVGQSPVSQAYTQRPSTETQPAPQRQERLETSGESPQVERVEASQSTATSGSVGRNIDTYA